MGSSLRRKRASCSTVLSLAVEALEERRLFTTYYDDAQASVYGLGSGTKASPWNSLYAISVYTGFQPGDVIDLSGTFTNQILFLANAQRGVTLTSLDPNNPATISESANYAFNNAIQVTAAGITISYLNMVGPGITSNSNSYDAINFDNTGTVQFTGATVDHVNESGFVFGGLVIQGNTSGFTNVTVTNSTFNDNQVSGLQIAGPSTGQVHSNVLISNVTASGNAGAAVYYNANNVGANQNAGNGGIFVASVNGGVITHCTAIGNCYNSAGACAIWAHNCNNLDVEYSEAADTRTTSQGYDGNGFDFDAEVTNSIIQYDYSHGNDGVGLYLCSFGGSFNDSNDTIRYCISDDDGRHGNIGCRVYCDGKAFVTNANIYNNTILVSGGLEEGFGIDSTGNGAPNCTVNFLNNVIYTINGAAAVEFASYFPSLSNVKMEGNDIWVTGYSSNFKLFWGNITYDSLSSFASGTGEETINGSTVGLNVNPLLNNEAVSDLPIANVSNLALSTLSTLWGAGQILTAAPYSNTAPYDIDAPYNLAGSAWSGIGTQDYYGNPLNQSAKPDLGAGGVIGSLTLTGTSGGDTFSLKVDASSKNSIDVNGTAHNGVNSVTINGGTGNETVIADFVNGPFGLTFNGGSGTNSLTTQNTGSGSAPSQGIVFTPGGASNSMNIAACSVTVPAGTQTGVRKATFSSIKISAGDVAAFSSAANHSNRTLVVITGSLTLAGNTNAWTSALNIGNNDLDVKGGNLATLNNQVRIGWNGASQTGIISSATSTLTSVGVIQNSVDGTASGAALYSTFDSAAVLNTDVLIKYTYFGDDNLSGVVDGSDYTRIDSGFLKGATGWFNGDFNYDGVINGSDYTLIDNAFNRQGASQAAEIAGPLKPTRSVSFVPVSQGEWMDPSSWLRKHGGVKVAGTTAIQAIENS